MARCIQTFYKTNSMSGPYNSKNECTKILKAIGLVVVALAVGIGYGVRRIQRAPDFPEIDLERWWGDVKPAKEDEKVYPFKITFNGTIIEDLKNRLANRRKFTPPMSGTNSEYGMNTIYLDKVLTYWCEEYKFDERAERLNKFSHYKTNIQGLDIHFIREKPESGKKVLPLLLMHGWPSSSKEFDKVIPMFTTPRDDFDFVFEVVAVDLPGFGFSEGTNKTGLNPLEMGVVMRNLMKRLGFDKFYIQAGDWGSQVGTHMATIFPNEILGFHTNMPCSSRKISMLKYGIAFLFPSLGFSDEHRRKMYSFKNFISYAVRETGYFHIQATKPDTIGAALTDTPVGIAAYVLEKVGICCNRDQLNTQHGGLEHIDLDDILDTLTILWTNERITTATRIYAEAFADVKVVIVHNIPTPVPTAAINFLYEVLYQPDWILKDKFPNLVHSTTLDFGGHFAALHTPKELVDDVFQAVAAFIEFHTKSGKL